MACRTEVVRAPSQKENPVQLFEHTCRCMVLEEDAGKENGGRSVIVLVLARVVWYIS